jgi:hypothetical protein
MSSYSLSYKVLGLTIGSVLWAITLVVMLWVLHLFGLFWSNPVEVVPNPGPVVYAQSAPTTMPLPLT